jgi:hypothetical protein
MIGRWRPGEGRVERNGFRWRGTEVGRLEALSDAVFGFAITLLVVSLEVPSTFTELLDSLRGLPAFAASFALLFLVWLNQYRFFRRYGLEDGVTIGLNAILLFVILFFVYPLKFVFQIVVGMALGREWIPHAGRIEGPMVSAAQGPLMMLIFGAGYVAVFLIFALLHVHAWRQRNALELDEIERYETLDNLRESLLNCGIGALSMGVAGFGGPGYTGLAGTIYWLVGPAMMVHGFWSGARRVKVHRRVMDQRAAAAAQPVAGD